MTENKKVPSENVTSQLVGIIRKWERRSKIPTDLCLLKKRKHNGNEVLPQFQLQISTGLNLSLLGEKKFLWVGPAPVLQLEKKLPGVPHWKQSRKKFEFC